MTKDEIISRLKSIEADVGALMRQLIEAPDPIVLVPLFGESSDAPEPKTAVIAKPVTLEDVRAALTDLTSAKGAATTKQLLAEYGVKKLSEIATDKYATLLADAKAWAGE